MRDRRTIARRLMILAAGLALIGLPAWWFRHSTRSARPPSLARVPAGYVEDAACARCHAGIAADFAATGMGQAWRRWRDAARIERLECAPRPGGPFVYQAVFPQGKHLQREYRAGADGEEHAVNVREAAYTLGSGLEGRSYVRSENGYLTVLPLGWYSGRATWDLNPGYELANGRFARPVTPPCMSCHTAMVAYRSGSGYAYEEPVPDGIGCQRCHGPGADHVASHTARHGDRPTVAMVNPATLPDDLEQDVCMQCHLLGSVALPQPGCDAWSFRPGRRLRDVRSDFFTASEAQSFRAVGHAPRSMASACYRASGGRMTCVFCHDPHKPASDFPPTYYNGRCLECHDVRGCVRPLTAGEAARDGDCVACHMPKHSVADIPHAVATEHWIRRPGAAPAAAADPTEPFALTPFWEDTSPGQLGSAYIEHFRSAMHDPRQAERGVALLEGVRSAGARAAEWDTYLGLGYFLMGQPERALVELQAALAKDPAGVDARHALGATLLRLGRKAEATEWFEETLARRPWYADADLTLAQLYMAAQRPEKLIDMEDRYFKQHPAQSERLVLVARALDRLKKPAARVNEALERAIAADGSLAAPHLVLAELAVHRGDTAGIETSLRGALRAEPDSSAARIAWAGYLASQQRRSQAVEELRRVLVQDPNNAAARRLLRDLGG